VNALEDTLAAALTDTAAEIPADSVPPLRLPARQARGPARFPWSSRARYILPAAAAASVAAVLAAAVAITSGAPGAGGTAAAAAAAVRAGVPAFGLALAGPVTGPEAGILHLAIRETRTGDLRDSIQPPKPYNSFCSLTGSGGHGVFVALACTAKADPGDSGTSGTAAPRKFFALRMSDRGTLLSMDPLAIAVPDDSTTILEAIAVSPDGSTLAVATGTKDHASATDPVITLFSMASGTEQRHWNWPGSAVIAQRSGGLGPLSWAADGKTIAFPLKTGSPARVQIRLLDTTAPGSSLRATTVAADFRDAPPKRLLYAHLTDPDMIITPDGSRVAVSIVTPAGKVSRLALAEFPTQAGPAVRTLDPFTPLISYTLYRQVLWSSQDGSTLIATSPSVAGGDFHDGTFDLFGWDQIGLVTDHGFRRLPGDMSTIRYIAF
jgi:hypothetical protein